MKPPYYQEFAAAKISHIVLAGGGYIKIIVGEYVTETRKISGPVTGITTQPLYFDVLLSPQQQLDIPIAAQYTVLVYVYKGELVIGASDKILKTGQLGQLINGDNIQLVTQGQSAQFLVLAALPLKEPIVQSGPFVMNTIEEIGQAFRDYRDGVLTQ